MDRRSPFGRRQNQEDNLLTEVFHAADHAA